LRKTTSLYSAGMAIAFALLAAGVMPAQTVPPGKPKAPPFQRLAENAPSQRFSLKPAPVAALGPLDDSLRDLAPHKGMLQVGVHRPVTASMMGQGAWQTNNDGSSVWRVTLQSDNAIGLRVHFTNFSVGDGRVWIHDTANPPKQVFGPYTGLGDHGNGDLWTEAVFADSVEVEYQPAPQAQASGLPPFQIAEIAHLYRFAGREAPLTGSSSTPAASPYITGQAPVVKASSSPNYSCFIDATCKENITTVSQAASATAFLLFTQPGGEFQCSGNMLNAPNGQPVLLTAGHCVFSNDIALTLTAAFNYITPSCNGAAPDPTTLPQVLGVQLLSFDDNPFENQDNATEILDDLDYSLIQMSGFPNAPGFTLAGYTTEEVLFEQNVTSLSYPQGLSTQYAYAPRVDSRLDVYGATPYANAYQIEYGSTGRIDSGSSGSGIFDDQGRLVGTLSTGVPDCNNPDSSGNCPANSTACDVTAFPYDTWYSKFSATYQQIRDFLELTLPPVLSTNPSVFYATPNPILISGNSGLGTTTLFFNPPSTTKSFQIRIGSPTGTLFAGGSGSGQAATGNWVSNGLQFYLQDTSNGNALTSANTLGVVTASVIPATATLAASPSTIVTPNGSWLGTTTLSWNAPGHSNVQLRVGSAAGTVFSAGGSTGTATTGNWVSDGLTFYLVDGNTHAVLATTVVHVNQDGASTTSPGNVGSAAFYLNPNPIQISSGLVGTTTVYWNAPGVSNMQIRVGSPTGPLMANVGSSGSAATGNWVVDGEAFYLVNAATNAVLGTTKAQVSYSTISLGNSVLQITNNPGSSTVNISWSSSVSSQVEIHANAPNGPLVGSQFVNVASGTATYPNATDGMVFYLQDVTLTYTSSNAPVSYPLTLQYTLATATVHLVH
jgi:hypothetical protein